MGATTGVAVDERLRPEAGRMGVPIFTGEPAAGVAAGVGDFGIRPSPRLCLKAGSAPKDDALSHRLVKTRIVLIFGFT